MTRIYPRFITKKELMDLDYACPYCGWDNETSGSSEVTEDGMGSITCGNCGGTFEYDHDHFNGDRKDERIPQNIIDPEVPLPHIPHVSDPHKFMKVLDNLPPTVFSGLRPTSRVNPEPFEGSYSDIIQYIFDNYYQYQYISYIDPKTRREMMVIPKKYTRSYFQRLNPSGLKRISIR